MRAICAVAGAFFVIIGAIAAITGEAAAYGAWTIAFALAALGLVGLAVALTPSS